MSTASGLLRLNPGEGRPVGLIVCASFCSAAGLMIGQSSIEALFFARYGVEKLPVMYLLLGGSMFVMSLGVSALLGSRGRARAFLLIPSAIAALALAGRVGAGAGVDVVYAGLWLLQGAAQFMLGLSVWGLAGIVTDTRQAKRFFPLIGAGSVLGQVVGGLATKPLATLIGAENLILVWVAALAGMVVVGRTLLALAGGRSSSEHISRRRNEGAFEQLRQGFRYVRRSALMRWMALGAILFSLLFFSLYLPFSRTATARYPDPDELAGFFGLFYAMSTAVALVLSLFGTNRLLARFGIPAVMLVLPLLYVAAFGVLTIQASFTALLVFRFVQVVWMQGGAVSSWEAVINTVPPERRDQTRAFLYGGPTQVGTVIAGVIGLVGENALSPRALFGIGLVSALLATVAMYRVRRAYARELVQALREGRPRVFGATPAQAEPFGHAREDAAAVAVATAALSESDARVRRMSAHILGDLEGGVAASALVRALEDEDAAVRETAVRSLRRGAHAAPVPSLVARVADPDAGVRRAALETLAATDGADDAASAALASLIRDADPAVRAAAAGRLLRRGPSDDGLRALGELAGSADPDVREAAYRAAAASSVPESFELALRGLDDPSPRVRAEAARAAGAIDPVRSMDVLVEAMADDSVIVREAVAEAFGRLGVGAVPPVVRALFVAERQGGALVALERLPLDGAADDVRRFAAETVAAALESHRLAEAVPAGGDEAHALLKDALVARAERRAITALRAAALLGDRTAMFEALDSLSVRDPGQRANALELIESVGDPHVVRPLLALWEARPSHGTDPDWLDSLRRDPDDWIRACAELVASRRSGQPVSTPDGQTDTESNETGSTDWRSMTQTLDTVPLMERVLFLRRVPLFADLPPSDLRPIALIADEHAYEDG